MRSWACLHPLHPFFTFENLHHSPASVKHVSLILDPVKIFFTVWCLKCHVCYKPLFALCQRKFTLYAFDKAVKKNYQISFRSAFFSFALSTNVLHILLLTWEEKRLFFHYTSSAIYLLPPYFDMTEGKEGLLTMI